MLISEKFEKVLTETGCHPKTIEQTCNLYRAGKKEDAILYLKQHRCALMDKMHESQKNVDKMDYLIRDAEKEF